MFKFSSLIAMGYDIDDAIMDIKMKNDPIIIDICKQFETCECVDTIEALRCMRYEAILEEDFICVKDIIHQFRWRGYEDKFWARLAPYIQDGGRISWLGEDGYEFEYTFNNKRMSRIETYI